MAINIWGWTIKRSEPETDADENLKSFAPPLYDDGAVNITTSGTTGTYIDMDGTVRTEAELVNRYREMSLQPDVDKAINEVVNEAIVADDNKSIVELNLDEVDVDQKIKDAILYEFDVVLNIIDFRRNAYDIFRRWYIDGRLYHHVIIDKTAPSEGIKEIRYIDPRKIRKIREINKNKDTKTGVNLVRTRREYYLYNEMGFNYASKTVISNMSQASVKISKDAIIHTVSGLMDSNNTMVLGYLHAAMKPLNVLRALEDANIIYHMARAPERRVFNVEIGNLPKSKAEEYMYDLMARHKNKISYNSTTGRIQDDRKFITMLEDFWFPKREGRGTEVSVLPGGTALPQLLESVEYFQDKLYESLKVPQTRMKPDALYNIGRATEITKDEINFAKFIDRLREKFNHFLMSALEKQLILRQIIAPEDWDAIQKALIIKYARDNYFAELKESEILNDRMMRLVEIDQFAGKYYSHEWIRRNVLKQSDDDMQRMDQESMDERGNPLYVENPFVPEDEPPVRSGSPPKK